MPWRPDMWTCAGKFWKVREVPETTRGRSLTLIPKPYGIVVLVDLAFVGQRTLGSRESREGLVSGAGRLRRRLHGLAQSLGR